MGVSVASISRFARAVGCDSLKALKTQLGRESLSIVKSMYQAIGPEDTDADIIEKVFTGNIQSLEETLKSLDRGDLIRAAGMVAKAPKVIFFGIGSSGDIAQDAALRLSQLNMPGRGVLGLVPGAQPGH